MFRRPALHSRKAILRSNAWSEYRVGGSLRHVNLFLSLKTKPGKKIFLHTSNYTVCYPFRSSPQGQVLGQSRKVVYIKYVSTPLKVAIACAEECETRLTMIHFYTSIIVRRALTLCAFVDPLVLLFFLTLSSLYSRITE